jgi:hypothetical protein
LGFHFIEHKQNSKKLSHFYTLKFFLNYVKRIALFLFVSSSFSPVTPSQSPLPSVAEPIPKKPEHYGSGSPQYGLGSTVSTSRGSYLMPSSDGRYSPAPSSGSGNPSTGLNKSGGMFKVDDPQFDLNSSNYNFAATVAR